MFMTLVVFRTLKRALANKVNYFASFFLERSWKLHIEFVLSQ